MMKRIEATRNYNSIVAEMKLLYSNYGIAINITRILWIVIIFSSLINVVKADGNHTKVDTVTNCVDGMIIPIW